METSIDPIVAFHLNNTCNMCCSFCYVEGARAQREATRDTIDLLLQLKAPTYICIGKEPTLSPDLLAYLVQKGIAQGSKIGIITNGILLGDFVNRFPRCMLHSIDITYHAGDRGCWNEAKVYEAARLARKQCEYLSVLFVLHEKSVALLSRAISFAESVGADICVVSPILSTKRAVPYDPALCFPSLEAFFTMLARSKSFLQSPITVTGIDDYHFLVTGTPPLSTHDVILRAAKQGIQDKVVALGDPFSPHGGHSVFDVDVLREEPVATHPLRRLNTNPEVQAHFPTVPIRNTSHDDVYKELQRTMNMFDYRLALTTP